MAGNQISKQVNLAQGYVPSDPNAYPDNLSITNPAQDERLPAGVYDGFNFMPTAYGYKSYFGLTQALGIGPLAEKVDHIFIFQTPARRNYLIALCDSGIWIKYGAETGNWTQLLVLPDIDTTLGVHYEWSFTIIENELYIYRQNSPDFWIIRGIGALPGYEFDTKTPTFLNMAAQQGIFRAGDRLGFWDSANAVAWSSIDLFDDFTPDIESGAGITTFGQIIGAITNILSHGDGFIIYATKSIVHVRRDANSPYLWEPSRILQDTGIAYRRQVTASTPDTLHYAYTTTGIYGFQNGSPEVIAPDVFDYFKLIATPKYLKYMEGRFLFISVLDDLFITGSAEYSDIFSGDVQLNLPTLDFSELMTGIEGGTYPEISICEALAALGEGAFLAENAPGDPNRPGDWGVPDLGGGIWTVEITGIDYSFTERIEAYDGTSPFGSLPVVISGDPQGTVGAFTIVGTVEHLGAISFYIETGSSNVASATIYYDGVVQGIEPLDPFGYHTTATYPVP